jgi:CO/xanthine dehydrogenase Mo-binding subunit
VALALERDGKFLSVKIRSFGNLGAFVSFRGAMPPVVNIGTVVGTYTTPAVYVEVSGMLTNTHCTSPYRGAGRPEASYIIERLIDIAADEMKIDPAELRRLIARSPLTITASAFAASADCRATHQFSQKKPCVGERWMSDRTTMRAMLAP